MFPVSPCPIFAQSIEAMGLVENEDIIGAAPTDDALTTYIWVVNIFNAC